MKLASVIVNNASKKTDKEFDYLIPTELDDIVEPGMKVIVPFGFGNKTIEGYVTGVKQFESQSLTSSIGEKESERESGIKYKYLIDVFDADGYSFIDAEGMRLAAFIKQRYHSTMNEAVRLMQPPGATLKEYTYIKLFDGLTDDNIINTKYEQITKLLYSDKFIELNQLNTKLGKKLKKAFLLEMQKLGIIEIKISMEQNVNIRTQTLYKIDITEQCLEFMQNPEPRLKRQAKILMELSKENELLTLQQICDKYSCSTKLIKALEEKGFLTKEVREVLRNPFKKEYIFDRLKLTEDQTHAVENINKAYHNGMNKTLIFGVTGCGKTEIYLTLIQQQLDVGNGAIMLVPEISLTPQTVERFKGRFGDIVAVLHSRLSEGERYDEWRRIKRGDAKVVIGARSAIFAPVRNLKIVIIDEEHEYSYKSETTPKYHTNDVAEFRVDFNKGMLVLGSATPSIESYYKAQTGFYNLVEISTRVENKTLPEVSIVDMREEMREGNRSMLSRELYRLIDENIKIGMQTILFLNRRGYSTFVSCRQCGYICKCGNCDVSMTYHLSENKLSCHYCGIESATPTICPACGSKYIKHFGTGTERIEQEIKKLFPKARTLRMDMDTTRRKGSHEMLYNEFKQNRADILIGTQMISKGMDFENVTVVGVISADTSLNLPDFRSAERTFQLLTQVAGRSGRGRHQGHVVIQTYEPDNFSIQCASRHDYKSFYINEIGMRQNLGNPPFADLIHIVFSCDDENELIKYSMQVKEKCAIFDSNEELDSLGPTPCHISKIKNNYRWHMVFRGKVSEYYNMIYELIEAELAGSRVNFSMDLNPYSML